MGLLKRIKENRLRVKARKKAYQTVYRTEYRKEMARKIRETAIADARRDVNLHGQKKTGNYIVDLRNSVGIKLNKVGKYIPKPSDNPKIRKRQEEYWKKLQNW